MEMGRLLATMRFGSHVYGTNTPSSDHDFKGLFIPKPKDILLQRANQTSIQINTKKNERAKNSKDDIDKEIFTILGFIRLCSEGQTVAIDMLFTPIEHLILTSKEWDFIQKNKNKLIHCGVSSFVGYCQTQAAKYGIKGSRVAAVRAALDFVKSLPDNEKLSSNWEKVLEFVKNHQSDRFSGIAKDGSFENFITIINIKAANGKEEEHINICNRKFGKHVTSKYAAEMLQAIFDNYGERAKQAERNEGIDWKALMHAVRVCGEAKELLQTGFITFPRPEKELLLKIRKGELQYKEVAEIIESGVEEVSLIQKSSTLPKQIDHQFWEEWLLSVLKAEIMNSTINIHSAL